MKRWLSSFSGEFPLAVITGSSVNALSFARSLGRRGIPVLVLDSDHHLAVHSRYTRVVQLPPASREPQAWIDTLLGVGKDLASPAVLIPTADPHAVLVAENTELLRPYYNFLVPAPKKAHDFVSKQFQVQYAVEMGVPVPRTHFPGSVEAIRELANDLRYPCILKPDNSHTGARILTDKKLLIVDSARHLVDSYTSLAQSDVSCLVQEIIPGPDSELVSYLGFWGAEGIETAFITKRKLRQFPALYGNGSIQVTEELPEVAELSRRLLKGLDYRGFAGVEFKFDKRDGSYRFVEINPRSSAMNELAVAAGVDFPWIAYRALNGELIDRHGALPFKTGIRCVNEEWDVQAYWALRREGKLNFRQWRESLRGAHRIIAARDDPKPFMAGLLRAASLPFRKGKKG